MKTFSRFSVFLSFSLVAGSLAFGQLPSARVDGLYPLSAQRGSELELTVTGVDLEGVSWMKFSHGAIKAEPKKGEDGAITPNVFVVKVGGDAPFGIHRAQVGGGKFGVSNFRAFVVGDLPEKEAGEGGSSMDKAFELELGQTVYGRSPANKFAWFKFAAKKGQRVLVEVPNKDLDTRLTPSLALYDAEGVQLESDPQYGLLDFTVPVDGDWFVRLNDFLYKGGADYVYRLTVSTRPRIDVIHPPVGKAGADNVFTLYGRNLPGGQPSELKTRGGKALEKKEVRIKLPSGDARSKLELTSHLEPRRAAIDHFEYRLESPQGASNAVFIGYGEADVVNEADGPNDAPGQAQKVNVPCEIAAKFFPAADKDRFRFTAKKDEVFRIEVFSERLGRPTHAFLLLEQLTKKDDGSETAKAIGQALDVKSSLGGAIFDLSTRDPALRFSAPADGDYRILVYDLFNSASDPLNVYRLSIRKEAPDFRLAAYGMLPPPVNNNSSPIYVKSPTVRKGEAFPLKVMALRRDGFKGAVDLEFGGLPAFVSYSPKRIPEGADSVTVLLNPSADAGDWDGCFTISGKAKVGGKEARRDCRFADVAWSSYDNQSKVAVSHVRIGRDAPLAVVGREKAPVSVLFDADKQVDEAKKAVEAAQKALEAADKKVADAKKAHDDAKAKFDADPKQKAAFDKARSAHHLAQANQAGRKADLAAKKANQTAFEKAKANPKVPRFFETSVGGALKLPVKLDSTDAFKAQTKIKVFGHKEAPKIKEINVDPKKKNEGVLDVNLASAKLPAGEHSLFCSAQVKGKYKVYSEEEAKKASEEAKKADERLKAGQKEAAEAKKALDEAKKALDAAEKEKDEAKIAAADKVHKEAEQKHKAADTKTKRLDGKKKAADALAKKMDDAVKKPKDVTVTLFTSPFTLKVWETPVAVTPLPKQTVKAGEKLNLDVAVERLFGFTDQISLKVTLPSNAKGISVKAANVLKDTYGATLEVTTNASSTAAGEFECKLEGTLRFNNQNLKFSEPFVLQVEPAPEKKG